MFQMSPAKRDLLVIFLFPIGLYLSLLMGDSVMKWDAVDLYLPWKFHVTECLSNGSLPLWNPYINNGFAQMGDPGTWYPISWLIAMCTGGYNFVSLHVEYLLHLIIAGSGFYLLAKQINISRQSALLIAIGYMCSGLMVGNAQHLGWIVSAAWIPWVFLNTIRLLYKVEKIYVVYFSLSLFLLLSGGYPGFFIVTFYSVMAYSLYTLWKQRIHWNKKYWLNLSFKGGGVTILFLLLSGVVLHSAFEMSEFISRGEGLNNRTDIWNTLEGSLYPNSLLTTVYPLSGSLSDWEFWRADISMVNIYFGVILLVLIIASLFSKSTPKKLYAFVGIALFFFLLTLGKTIPLRLWLSYLPFMDLFRFPSLFKLFTILFVLLAAGVALENLQEKRKALVVTFSSTILLLGIVNVLMLSEVEKWKFLKLITEGWDYFIELADRQELLFLQGSISILLVTLLLVLLLSKNKWFHRSVLLVVLFEFFLFTRMQMHSTVLKTNKDISLANTGVIDAPKGFPIPSLITPLSDFSDQKQAKHFKFLWRNLSIFRKTPSFDGYSPYAYQNMNRSIESGEFEKFNALPFAFYCSSLDVNNYVSLLSMDTLKNVPLSIATFEPNKFSIHVDSPQNGYLIINQNYYPHWKAIRNNSEVSIIKVSETFIAVPLNTGKNTVELNFKPIKTKILFWVSIITLSLPMCLLCFFFFRSRISFKKKH